MRISVSLTTSLPGIDPRIAVRNAVERARAANDAGLDGLFVGDHHVTPTTYLQNTPILGRLLAEWGDRPAGCLFLFPLWNPVLIAEQVGTLAVIAQGRFIVQTGLGGPVGDFLAMGVNPKTKPSAFEEGLSIVRRLLAGETVSSDGRFRFENAKIAPVAPEPVEFWIGASADAGIDRAARLGDAFLGAPGGTPTQARRQVEVYLAAAAREGRPPIAALRRDIYIAADDKDAAAVRDHAATSRYRGMPVEALIIGTVEEAAETMKTYETMGYGEIVIRHLVDDQTKVLASYERLTEVRRFVS